MTTDATMGAASYYGSQLQQLGCELTGLGYKLCHIHEQLRASMGRSATPQEFANLAGTAARLRAQVGNTTAAVEQLMFDAEKMQRVMGVQEGR